MTKVERIKLRPDYAISRIVKGGWQLAGDHGAVDRAQAVQAMLGFVDAGIIAFDCADIYTGVEALIGEFIALLRRERGRELQLALKIHTKFVPDYASLHAVDRTYVNRIIDRSLCRLGVERLDLVQFHWWDYTVPGCLETLMLLDELRRAGKIDRLGVTNFDAEHIDLITSSGIDLVSAQVQYSLLDQRPAAVFADLCRERNVYLLCYGVLAGGFISQRWLGAADPGYEFENRSLIKYRLIIDEFGGWPLFQQLLQVLALIGERHGVGLSAIAMRYMLDRPQVAGIIIGARYADYLADIRAAFGLALDQHERQQLDAVLAQRKGPDGPVYGLERDRHGRHGRIMKYNLNS